MMRCRTGREAPRNKAARIKNHHDKEVRCGRREIATRYDGAGSITFLSGLKSCYPCSIRLGTRMYAFP